MHVRRGTAPAAALTDLAAFDELVRSPLWVGGSFQSNVIRSWRSAVGEQRFRTFLMDDLVSDPTACRRSMFAYLGLDDSKCGLAASYNRKASNPKADTPDRFRKFLVTYFTEEYEALAALVGEDRIARWRVSEGHFAA